MEYIIFYVLLISFVIGSETGKSSPSNEEQISKLRSKLLENYDKNLRPSKNQNNATVVRFGMALNNQNLDDALQTMSINAWLIILWDDDYLKWSKEDFSNLSRIHLSPKDVWTPDLILYNSKNSETFSMPESIPLVVLETGMVMWFPPFWGEVPCNINIEKWPSDFHSCEFIFSAWSHNGMIDMQSLIDNNYGGVILDNYEVNSKWGLKNVSCTKEFVHHGQEQKTLSFNLTVQRMMSRVVSYISTSAFAIIIVLISSYGLPLELQVIRIVFHLFAFLIFTLYCAVLSFIIPSRTEMPLIVTYYGELSLLTLFSLVVNMFFSKLFGSGQANFGPRNKTAIHNTEVSFEEVELATLVSQPSTAAELDIQEVFNLTPRILSVLWLINFIFGVTFAISYLLVYYNMKKDVF